MSETRRTLWRNARGTMTRLWMVSRKGHGIGLVYAYTKAQALDEARAKFGRGVTVTVS